MKKKEFVEQQRQQHQQQHQQQLVANTSITESNNNNSYAMQPEIITPQSQNDRDDAKAFTQDPNLYQQQQQAYW